MQLIKVDSFSLFQDKHLPKVPPNVASEKIKAFNVTCLIIIGIYLTDRVYDA